MTNITTRSAVGRPLSYAEMDGNFNNLNSGKAEVSVTDSLQQQTTTLAKKVASALQSLSAFALSSGSSLIGFTQSGVGAAVRTVQDELRDYVSPMQFGAKGDGLSDDTASIQAATNTGKAVYFPPGSYRMTGPVNYNGRVVWLGSGMLSRFLNDGPVLVVQNGGGSTVDNLYAENITAPWIIYRDPNNWSAVPVPVQSNGPGYQPTINDQDIWANLTAAQKNQDIGPMFLIHGDSGINVSRIYGRFVTVWVYDAVHSTVSSCNFRGGKNINAGIMFWNVDGAIGYGNKAVNNVVTYPSFSGVSMARNYDGVIDNNIVAYAGESGIKTCQNLGQNSTGQLVDLRCYRMAITDNKTRYSYYDGLDLSADYPHTGTLDLGYRVIGNDTYGNRQTGFYGDGQNILFSNNSARECGLAGIDVLYNGCKLSDNFVDNCNTVNLAAANQINIIGDSNLITDNYSRRLVNNGYGIYAPGNNINRNNTAKNCSNFYGNTGNLSVVDGDADASSNQQTTQCFQFVLYNNGGTINHLFKAENVQGAFGARITARINLSTNNLSVTPIGPDATTGFGNGAKISTTTTNVVLLDTVAQSSQLFEGLVAIEQNQTGTALTVQVGLYNTNVNGVAQLRLGFGFFNASTGDPYPISSTQLAAGKALCVRFYGRIA